MSLKTDDLNLKVSNKKLRFRPNNINNNNSQNRIEEIFVIENRVNLSSNSSTSIPPLLNHNYVHKKVKDQNDKQVKESPPSFLDFFKVEMTRGYILEHDEERYSARRQKIYSFMRIPRDLERFMVYGIMQCADSFLYIHTFLPVRFILAIWSLISRLITSCFGLRRRYIRLLSPAEKCDLLKSGIWLVCTLIMLSVDTNYMYHIIKSQSIIKLYIFYNMLEVGDRLLSAFGQDSIDALFWTATEPKNSKADHLGLIPHIFLAFVYVLLHSALIMFQTTALNVAINSSSKALLTIMISNNFVELKGSVFKKFDKNNLFQLSCSDVRERFHLTILLFVVIIQTMKEFNWNLTQFYVMLPDCFYVLVTEIFIDWLKHAFITRFNELPETIYREYTTSLAYDMTQTRQKHAFSDHSDLVARRMGFIPFPLGVVLIKTIYSAVSLNNFGSWLIFILGFTFALGLRIWLTICALGKACKLMKEHQEEKHHNVTPNANTNHNIPTIGISSQTSPKLILKPCTDAATSPKHQHSAPSLIQSPKFSDKLNKSCSQLTSTPLCSKKSTSSSYNTTNDDIELDVENSLELGATALFSNSDVDLDDVCLNEKVLDSNDTIHQIKNEHDLVKSTPNLSHKTKTIKVTSENTKKHKDKLPKRTHKRSESEPGIKNLENESQC